MSLTRSDGDVMGGLWSTKGTESDVRSKKKERENTIKRSPREATSQLLLAHFLYRSRELNVEIAIEEGKDRKNSVLLHTRVPL